MSEVKIGCIAVVKYKGKLFGIKCAKGRGFIMAGGKWDGKETFLQTALRELEEETGIHCDTAEFIFGGMSEEGYYTYAFRCRPNKDAIRQALGNKLESGEVALGTWEDLKKSKFGGFYEVFEHVLEGHSVTGRTNP